MPLTPLAPVDTAATESFIARWAGTTASELATAQSFVIELCELLAVAKPHATAEQDYMFERPVTFSHGNGSTSAGRIDCYRRGHFVLEAKKLKAGAHTKGFDDGLLRARSQGEAYARALPAAEGRPPFVLVVDVGTVIELYAEFSQSGATYTPFPDPRSHRLVLADLAKPEVQERLRRIWLDPHSLNPARISAQVTRGVAALLAELARSLEGGAQATQNFKQNHALTQAEHVRVAPQTVAAYLTRCLFCMFAEDVELLPKGSFQGLLQTHRDDPATLQQMMRILWADMDTGGFSAALAKPVLHFNGKLFKGADQADYSLLLTPSQIDLLIEAAKANWREVEPAIFGTLLERALDPTERHALGAHYTPRAYVERLVLPTVIEPLRADWANAQAAALVLAHEAAALEAAAPAVTTKADFAALDRHNANVRALRKEAREQVRGFLHQLCTTRVLDPACGSANFLYVTLEHLKRLEGEVLNQLDDLGDTQDALDLGRETVTLQQLLGIEINERAAALAELVLWIGYLQWQIRTRGNQGVAEPVVHNYGNIECRDAVLAWDSQEPAYDKAGQLLARWDGRTFKTHPITGEPVPDEAAQVPQWRYVGARRAQWPQVDFIVGNPPFIGAASMRAALGDGYVEALRGAWPEVPESADFVMFWWHHAALQVACGRARRMGLITTNSLRQTFNRRVVQAALAGAVDVSARGLLGAMAGADGGPGAAGAKAGKAVAPVCGPSHLCFAIPDHPWVDSANGAAVRIAMTVLAPGAGEGAVLRVTGERTCDFGEVAITVQERRGLVHADLSVGANVAAAVPLRAMAGVSSPGVKLHGAGFIVTPDEAAKLLPDGEPLEGGPGGSQLLRDYRNGRDLTDKPRGVKVIDAFGWSAEDLRQRAPHVYQWLLERVKPERDAKGSTKDGAGYAKLWWLHGKPRQEMRKQLAGLPRYIATVETAKHRTFQFLDASILPDNKLIAIALQDALSLGVLSSRLHGDWALATGSWLGVGNDPVYVKSRCFETFPFPDTDTGLTPPLRERIAQLAEQIDAHRKRVLAPDTGAASNAALTLTGIYNVLTALREGRALTAKEKFIHTQGLVGVLRELHDELDAAVLAAYGLPAGASTDDILLHLVQLNTERAQEEAQGRVRWLRPEFQNLQKTTQKQELPAQEQQALEGDFEPEKPLSKLELIKTHQHPWPSTLPEQVRAVAEALARSPAPLTLPALEAHFKGRGPWKKGLPTLLQTLEALGRAQAVQVDGAAAWRG